MEKINLRHFLWQIMKIIVRFNFHALHFNDVRLKFFKLSTLFNIIYRRNHRLVSNIFWLVSAREKNIDSNRCQEKKNFSKTSWQFIEHSIILFSFSSYLMTMERVFSRKHSFKFQNVSFHRGWWISFLIKIFYSRDLYRFLFQLWLTTNLCIYHRIFFSFPFPNDFHLWEKIISIIEEHRYILEEFFICN